MDILNELNDFTNSNDESLPMLYDIVRTVTVQVIVQILFTMNNPSVSGNKYAFIQTTLFLILGIMVFYL